MNSDGIQNKTIESKSLKRIEKGKTYARNDKNSKMISGNINNFENTYVRRNLKSGGTYVQNISKNKIKTQETDSPSSDDYERENPKNRRKGQMYGSEGNSVKNKSRLENPTTHFKKNLKEIDQENVRTETKKKIENMIRTQTEGCAREMDTSIEVERTSTKDKNKDTKDEVTNAIVVEDNNKKRVSKNECKRVTWADVVRGNSEEETKQQSMLINLK